MASLSLEHRQVDLWYVLSDKVTDSALLDRYRELLAPDELARERRFLNERARLQYLAGRALIRTTLSQYAEVRPEAWRFSYNPHGKPAISSPREPRLEFNLSHTDGVLVLAVTAGPPIGVDVESRCRKSNALELASRFFAAAEAATLQSLSPDQCDARFFQFWTLKEAFIKARGTGLAMPLDRFAFTLTPGQPPRIAFFGVEQETPDQWQFLQFHLAPTYQLALAVRLPESQGLALRAWETVPLLWRSEEQTLTPNAERVWTLGLR